MRAYPYQIVKAVCSYYDITSEKLFKPRRTSDIILKRQIFIYIALTETGCTLRELIEFIKFNHKLSVNHATLIYTRNKIKTEKEIYYSIYEDIENIKSRIQDNKLIPHNVDLLQLTINYTNSFIN